jgi:hypothetical protein
VLEPDEEFRTVNLPGTIQRGVFVLAVIGGTVLPADEPPSADPSSARPGPSSYKDAIQPLLKARYVRCHGPNEPEGGLDLSRAATLLLGGGSGPALADTPDESLLWHRVSDGEMPPERPLAPAEQEALRDWIAAGMPGLAAAEQVVYTSLLGLSIKCARCHDHKFEPLTQREYYQQQAILYPAFNPEKWVKPRERMIRLATAEERVAREAKQAEVAARLTAARTEHRAWVARHRPRGRSLFRDDGTMPAGGGNVWRPAPEDAPPARRNSTGLVVDAPVESWLATAPIAWVDPEVGAAVQVTFDLVADRAAPRAEPCDTFCYVLSARDIRGCEPLVLDHADLPPAPFAFCRSPGRGFTVANVAIERHAPPPVYRGDRLFCDDGTRPVSDLWSDTAPGDPPPDLAVLLADAVPNRHSADHRGTRLRIVSGMSGESWLCTQQSFDWTPESWGGRSRSRSASSTPRSTCRAAAAEAARPSTSATSWGPTTSPVVGPTAPATSSWTGASRGRRGFSAISPAVHRRRPSASSGSLRAGGMACG